MRRSLTFCFLCLLCSTPLLTAQNAPGSPSVILTILPNGNAELPAIEPAQVTMHQGGNAFQVTGMDALTAEQVPVELFILLDDNIPPLGQRLVQIKDWIKTLPPGVVVGLGYMKNGITEIVSAPNPDHNQAADKMRDTMGSSGTSPSPMDSVVNLVSRWPARPTRHEILVITDGEELVNTDENDTSIVKNGIAKLLQRGVVVYSIFAVGKTSMTGSSSGSSSQGTSARSSGSSKVGPYDPVNNTTGMQTMRGQTNLAEETQATGGAFYTQGNATPVSFTQYLDEISLRLQHQYRLTYVPSEKSPHGQQVAVKIQVDVKDAKVTSPGSVYIK